MAEQNFPNVWYASEKRIRSTTKLIVYEDKGKLDIDAAGVRFSGNKTSIDMATGKLLGISLARQGIPWKTYLIIDLIALPILVCATGLIPAFLLLFVYNAAGFLLGWSTRWVLLEYLDPSGNPQKAYFADGSFLGWGGFLGGTGKLHQALLSSQGS